MTAEDVKWFWKYGCDQNSNTYLVWSQEPRSLYILTFEKLLAYRATKQFYEVFSLWNVTLDWFLGCSEDNKTVRNSIQDHDYRDALESYKKTKTEDKSSSGFRKTKDGRIRFSYFVDDSLKPQQNSRWNNVYQGVEDL